MSIEDLLTRTIAALEKNTTALEKSAEATEQNTAHLAKVIAGQAEALAKIEARAGAAPATTAGKGKDKDKDKPAGKDKPADKDKAPETPAAPPASKIPAEVSGDELKAYAQGYIGPVVPETDPGFAARRGRGLNVKALMEEFGVKALVGPEGIQDPEERRRAYWYITRYKAGLKVDFKATFDPSADPEAPDATPADEFGDL